MKRPYRLGKRAESAAATRERILAAAEAQWRLWGPRAAAVTEIARRAGVDRLTVYKHFPDEAALASGVMVRWEAREARPDLRGFAALEDPEERLRATLLALWPWYGATREMTGWVLRDGPAMGALGPAMEEWRVWLADWVEALSVGRRRTAALQPTLATALGFGTWEALVAEGGLSPEAAAELVEGWVRAAETSR